MKDRRYTLSLLVSLLPIIHNKTDIIFKKTTQQIDNHDLTKLAKHLQHLSD